VGLAPIASTDQPIVEAIVGRHFTFNQLSDASKDAHTLPEEKLWNAEIFLSRLSPPP
jgi:hypothetical protein